MYSILCLNLLVLWTAWGNATALCLAVVINVAAYIERRTALATRGIRR